MDLEDEIISYHLNRIADNKDKIDLLSTEIDESKMKVQEFMGDAEVGIHQDFQVRWYNKQFKARPERVTPAKDAYSVRSFTIKRSKNCLLYTSPSPRDGLLSRMPSSA